MARRGWSISTAVLLASTTAFGQSGRRAVTPPVVASVSPPGGQAGTTVEWTITGRGLARMRNLVVSGDGIEPIGLDAKGDGQAVASARIASGAEPGFRELRVEGPDGVSNLVMVRVDTLPQAAEAEPNDEPTQAQRVAIGSSVAGTLRATDLDHYRVEGPPGTVVTFDLEARRVGTSLSPVLTAMTARGGAIAQARESRSADRDPRLAVAIPRDGALVVQVRDNIYGGNDAASYRLRVTTTPHATGLFPLGGPKGQPLTLTASGGSLTKPLTKTIRLPDTPGAVLDPGPFATPDGPVPSPMSVLVGDGPEVIEAGGDGATPIRLGETANGRIGRRGEVDRYAMTVKAGQKFRVRVVAEPLGSWLDSVLTVRDEAGKALAENDDSSPGGEAPGRRGVNAFGVPEEVGDSQLDFEAQSGGPIAIEVADRYGEGGPEYGYRLLVGAARPDFFVSVLVGNPNASGQVFNVANNRGVVLTPGLFGVFNLPPGARVPVNFLVVPQGRPGPVTVRAEGLPAGVSAAPVKVDVLGAGPKGGSPSLVDAPAKAESVVLEVAPYATPGLGSFRLVATAEPEPGVTLTRVASATLGLDAVPTDGAARPIHRRLERFPLRIVGEEKPGFVGPPEEPRLLNVTLPGVLLQGDRVELGLEFDNSPLLDPGFKFEAKVKAKGVGLATNTVIASGASMPDADEEPKGDVLVRVLASAKAVPGVYPVSIRYTMTGGKPHDAEAVVIVRPPIELLTRAEDLTIAPGGSATLWVGVRREVTCREEVEVRVFDLPRGVHLAGPVTLTPREDGATLRLEMPPGERPLAKATTVRVVASVRMPRGVVAVESGNRPMIGPAPAER